MPGTDRTAAGGPPPRRRTAPPILLLTTALAIFAVAGGIAGGWDPRPGLPWWAFGLLLASLAVAGFLRVDVRHGEEVDAVDLFETVLTPVIFLLPGGAAVVMAATAKAVAEGVLRVAPLKAAFNIAQWAAATAAGSLLLEALTSGERTVADLPALAAAMVVVTLVNQAAVATVLRIVDGRPLREVLSELRTVVVPAWIAGSAVTLVVGLVFAAAFAWSPATIPLFPAVLAALHLGSRGYAATLADRAQLRGLHRATHALAVQGDPDDAIPAFLAEVRGCFDADTADLLVVEDDVPVLHRVRGNGPMLVRRQPQDTVGAEVLRRGAPVAAEAGESPDDVARLLRREDRRDVIAVPLPTAGEVAGALSVYDRRGVRGDERSEQAVLEALAGEVGHALARRRLLTALRSEEARFRLLVQRSSDMVTVVDADGVVRYVSPAVGQVLGLRADDIVDRPVRDLVHPRDTDDLEHALRRARADEHGIATVTHRGRTSDGSWRPLDTVVTNLLREPWVSGLVLHSRDATDRQRVESLLTGQAETLEAIARDAPVGQVMRHVAAIVEAHAPGARVAVAVTHAGQRLAADPLPALTEPLGLALAGQVPADEPLLTVEDISADPITRIVAPAAQAAGVTSVWALPINAGRETIGMIAAYHPSPRSPGEGERRVLEQAGNLVCIALERARSRERLVEQATRDPLTGLPNRTLFLDRTRLALARSSRRPSSVAVLFIDLDRFKIVNDSLGHDAGDRLLVALSNRLLGVMRPGDTVARFGGDEFTVLCEEVRDEDDAIAIAERVAGALAKPVALDDRELFVEASVGVALARDADVRAETLLGNADSAMYRAKERGGGRLEVFHERIRAASRLRLATHSDLHRAVQRGEFLVVYQPIVDLGTGRAVGAEALVRWRHPERGLLGPGSFIATAEETGLIVPLGAHVLREACRQARAWHTNGHGDLTISINISARQFTDPALPERVADALETSGVTPLRVSLELTESTLMGDGASTVAALHALKALGVGLSVDDFGTGYSSLSYLTRFPVDGLKVDRSFVSGLGTDSRDTGIVAAIVRLAHTLGLSATAEGVEKTDQVTMLRDLGCERAQGFLYARPAPADELDLDAGRSVARS